MKEETLYDQTLVTEEFCESQVKESQKIGNGLKMVAAALGGAVIGSAATRDNQVHAANIPEEITPVEEENNVQETETTPVEEESNVQETETSDVAAATTASVPVTAPVAEVSDDMSFSQAFASARRQVGAGGVFAWRGKVYGTYYKTEWDNMTAEEKAEYHASVDYNKVPHSHTSTHETHTDLADNHATAETHENDSNSNAETPETATDSADVDVHVISVEHNVMMNEQTVDVAVIDVDGHSGLLVDIDQDGFVEGAIVDYNDDGQIQQEEVSPNLSDSCIPMPQMSDGDMYISQNDDMPDYINDAMA